MTCCSAPLMAAIWGERLFVWLDSAPARYWAVAWGAFAVTTLVALLALTAREAPRWARHPAVFGVLALLTICAFRWPVLLDNRQIANPDESQLMAGALTLRHDGRFWLSVDGTTHGPLAEWPLLVPLWLGLRLDYTAARTMSVGLAWIAVMAAWLVFRRLFEARRAGALCLPLLAGHAFSDFWDFVQVSSEHAPAALLAVGAALLLLAWDAKGRAPRRGRLFASGLALGAAPFAKLAAVPPAAWIALCGIWWILTDRGTAARHRGRPLAVFVAGGLAVPVGMVAWVIAVGTWPDFWQSYVVDNVRYTGARWFTWAEAPAKFVELSAAADGFGPFCRGLAVCAAGGLVAAPWLADWPRRCVVFAVGLALTTFYAVMAPGRLFMHYLQLLHFPLALAAGVAAGAALAGLGSSSRPLPAVWAKLSRRTLAGGVGAVFLAAGLLPQVLWRARADQGALGRFTATHGRLQVSPVAAEVLKHAQPGEALGLWGWMPAFYVETGLHQATRDGNDSRQIDPSPEQAFYRARFLADLRRSRPPVILDAVGPGNFNYQTRATEAHETFPALAEFIRQDYQLVADRDGTRVYVRRDRL